VIEAQRRIHELEAQREQEQQGEAPRVEAPPRDESQSSAPPAFLASEPAQRSEPPQREEPRAAPPERQPAPPRIDPKELLDSAGLVMIETDRSKAPPIAPQAEEPVQLGRPRRERSKPAQEEELKQVETKR
jgi:hypothetical protein